MPILASGVYPNIHRVLILHYDLHEIKKNIFRYLHGFCLPCNSNKSKAEEITDDQKFLTLIIN